MATGHTPLDWARRKAIEKINAERDAGYWSWRQDHSRPVVVAFARYIAEHEEAPVDPLLIEARGIAERRGWISAISLPSLRSGEFDGADTVQALYEALKRGMELAQATSPEGASA